MLNKLINFLKYNNATVIILALILIIGGGALAAGPDAIGSQQTSVQGTDNNLLLSADLANFQMDFKIEKIEQDDSYYYATYSYLDLVVINQAWQYQLNQKTVKINKKIKEDLGIYLEKYLTKHHEARTRELTQAQQQAQAQGQQTRIEVTEYTGLIGQTLNIAAKVFPNYEPVKKVELPTPEFNLPIPATTPSSTDNLTQIYNNYIETHPDLFTDTASTTPIVEETASTTPELAPEQSTPDTDATGSTGSPQVITEPTNVDVIELPVSPPGGPAETAPATDTTSGQ